LLLIKNLYKSFGKHEVIRDLSLSVESGEIVGLLGKNGAGKTTLIKCISQFYKYRGDITIGGTSYKDHPHSYLSKVGVLLQPSYFDYMSAMANMNAVASLFYKDNREAAKKSAELLELMGLSNAAEQLVKEFSFGMKQRLGVAMALLRDPDVLILDEPTIGVDPKGLILLIERIKYLANERKKSILFSSNNLSEVQDICGRIVMIGDGEMKEDRRKEEIVSMGNQYKVVFQPMMAETVNFLNASGYLCEHNTVHVKSGKALNHLLAQVVPMGVKIADLEKSNVFLQRFYD